MWLLAGVFLLSGLLIWRWADNKSRYRGSVAAAQVVRYYADQTPAEYAGDASILTSRNVQRSLAGGAPPIPWQLRREDSEAMDALAAYFARAIPTPTPDGRTSVREIAGHGGPQLELYVPVLSTKSPVAVLARNWDNESESLEANLFFFGAVNGRVKGIVSKLGFEPKDESANPGMTVFRNRRKFERQRAG